MKISVLKRCAGKLGKFSFLIFLNSQVPLAERLDEYYEDPGLATKSASIIKLPPDMTPIPCKPLFFDLAQNQLDYPPLEDKLDVKVKPAASGAQPAGISGFVKGLWGWGGAKQ